MKLMLALLLYFIASPAFACSCPEGRDGVEEAFDAADLVFTGEARRLNAGYYEQNIHATLFTPEHIFKGVGGKIEELAIATVEDGENCDLLFWEGKRYVVYAKLDDRQHYRATICSRTNFMSGAEEEIASLKKLEYDALRQVPGDIEKYAKPQNQKH